MPFSEVIGQDNPIKVLRRAIATDRVPHAYLFSGIEGCGKMKTALALIEELFCESRNGCGTCPSCRHVGALQHPDLHIIEPDGQFIKIDQIRELQSTLNYRPYEAPKKACIIDGADRLNPAAGNALLKTLEEPPGHALLILLTSRRSMVLPTILSRCQDLVFQALSEKVIEQQLVQDGMDEESSRIASSLANGSLKRGRDIVAENALAGRKEFLGTLMSLSINDISPLFATAEQLSTDKDSLMDKMELFTSFLRDILLVNEKETEVINSDLLPLIQREALRITPTRVMELLDHVAVACRAIQRNVNARLAIEVLLMRVAARS
jgi:DNA polymerase-3 subunit delta'